MVDILHKVGIKSSSLPNVYKALTTREGLAGWWTNDTRGEGKVGSVLEFRFGTGGIDMKVLELDPDKRVLWQVVDGPEEWIGTKVSFGPTKHNCRSEYMSKAYTGGCACGAIRYEIS